MYIYFLRLELCMRFSKRESISKEEENYIRFTAYDALVEFGERSLPVLSEFDRIIHSTIFIFSMQSISRRLGHNEDYFSIGDKGIGIYVSLTGHHVLLYNDKLPSFEIRWTIARLLYLVISGKLEKEPDMFHYADCPEDMERCDLFACYFTCPDIILDTCEIHSASDIINYCGIPFSYADKKSRALEKAANTNIQSLQPIEEILKNHFAMFIEHKSKHKVERK